MLPVIAGFVRDVMGSFENIAISYIGYMYYEMTMSVVAGIVIPFMALSFVTYWIAKYNKW